MSSNTPCARQAAGLCRGANCTGSKGFVSFCSFNVGTGWASRNCWGFWSYLSHPGSFSSFFFGPASLVRCWLNDTIKFKRQMLCIFSSVQTASFVEGLFLWKGWFLHLHGLEAWFMSDSSHDLGSVQPLQTCTGPIQLKHMWYDSWHLLTCCQSV